MTKPLDGVARGHLQQTVGTAGYAILEARIQQALAGEVGKLRRKGHDQRESDYSRGWADCCEWLLRLPEEILGNSPGA